MNSSETDLPQNEDDDILEDNFALLCLAKKFVNLFGFFFFGYMVAYFGLSLWWVSIAAFLLVVREKDHFLQHQRVEFQRAVGVDEKAIIKCAVKDLPCWVYFPDTERAEWLNKILKQMWPFVAGFMSNLLKTQIEQNIDDVMPDYCKGFRFEKIDFGNVPPRLGSVKCYDDNTARDEIILDLELIYAGNCDIQVRIKGLSAGIKEFQVYGTLRVELKPLIKESPLIGCVSFYFLQNPIIEYNFTNLGNILDFPGVSDFLRKGIKEQFAKFIVLPNKYVMPLVADFQASAIKFIQPIGVVRLEVIEAHNLKKSDVGMLGMRKSDPYVNIFIGNQEFRTFTIYNTINPKWHFICETPVFLTTQSIDMDVMDEDQGSKDDFLGKASFPLDTIYKEGIIDAWVNLMETKTGRIHLKATWLSLEHSKKNLIEQEKESARIRSKYREENREFPFGSVACLLVYLDCAKNLPISAKSIGEPSPQVIFKLRNHEQKSIVKNFTSNPIWEESFHFLLDEFNENDNLSIEIVDNKSNQQIGRVKLRLQSLTEAKDMTFAEPLVVRQYSHNFDLHITISLYFLKSPKDMERVKIVRDDTVDSGEGDNIPTMEDLIKGTVQPFAGLSGITGDIVEMSQHKRQPFQNGKNSEQAVIQPAAQESGNDLSPLLKRSLPYPMLEVSVNKMVEENRLEVLVHRASNLRKVNNRYPHPYVKLYQLPERKQATKEGKHNRSSTIRNSINPVFNERFYIDLNESIDSLKFVVYTRSNSTMFMRNKIVLGFVEIYFNDNFLEKDVSFTKWYELEQQDD